MAVRTALPALCRERGFRKLSEVELCRRAGISAEDFHGAYQDREDAFAAVYEEFAQEFIARMLATFDAELEWREQIRAVAHAFLAYLQEDPDRAYLTVVDSFNGGERAQVVRDSVMSALFGLIDAGRQELDDPDSLTPVTAESVGGAIFLRMRKAVEREGTEGLSALLPELMHMTVLPYLGPEAAAEELAAPPPASAEGPARP